MSNVNFEKNAYLDATPMQKESVHILLGNLLALLRAQSLSYQTSHWQATGPNSYGNHLLFARLYESVGDQIDQLAEKMVGYLGVEAVGLEGQAEKIAGLCGHWEQVPCHHERGILSEFEAQSEIRAAYDGIKKAGAMTLGLDDWLMATASAHEENTYLLQQALETPQGKQASLPKYEIAAIRNGVQTNTFEGRWGTVRRKVRELSRAGNSGYVVRTEDGFKLTFVDVLMSAELPPIGFGVRASSAPPPEAPSAESHFFDNPEKWEVLEFADSGAISNDPEVAAEAVQEDSGGTRSVGKAVEEAEAAPPTPKEILEEPGSPELSTLNRYQVASSPPTLSTWALALKDVL